MTAAGIARGAAGSIALAAAAAGLCLVPLPGGFPPVAHFRSAGTWWAAAGPVGGAYGVGRLVVVAVLSMGAIGAALRTAVATTQWGARLSFRLAGHAAAGGRRVGLAGLLRLLLGVSAAGVVATACSTGSGRTTGTATAAAPGPPASLPPPTLVARPAGSAASGGGPPSTPTPAPASAASGGGPTSTPTPAPASAASGGGPASTPTPAPASAARAGAAPAAPAASPSGSTATAGTAESATWVVRPGDDLWSIAARVVAGQLGPVGDGPVWAYWQALIAANRDNLPVPSDPNLIFPGDQLILPSLAAVNLTP